MGEKTLKELEEFAKRKGFLLTDGDAEFASFKTETTLRRFLEGLPDDPVRW